MAAGSSVAAAELRRLQPPPVDLNALIGEIGRADLPWRRHYSEYQSGGWWTCSLLGRSADATDGAVTDNAPPLVTDALARLPVTAKLIQDMPLRYMTARLARLDPDGALWEHRDYQDLRRVARQRIHLPIETNGDAILVSGGRKFHMDLGSLWSFCPTAAHGSCNAGSRPRIHIIFDVYEDARLEHELAAAPCAAGIALPRLTRAALAAKVTALAARAAAADVAEPESLRAWERDVLSLYFACAPDEGEIYRLLEQACAERGESERARFWQSRGRLVLGAGLEDA